MIVKQAEPAPRTTNPRRKAGHNAERQMAFYLHRAFANDNAVFVLNDLRIVDEETPEHDGSPTTCQIDHLLIHRWGMFIIESKSVNGHVEIRDDGSGGDEWIRKSDRYGPKGMHSPIQQARAQAEVLRNFLQRHREQLLGKMPFGLRTLTKLRAGTDQRGFTNMPIQVIVAIADQGSIRRIGKWREPEGPFGTFVCKADLAADKVRMEFDKHKSSAPILTKDIGEYGMWSMEPEEAPRVAHFLADRHTPPSRAATQQSPPTVPQPTPSPIEPTPAATPQAAPSRREATTSTPACKACGGNDLAAQWGRYGYYWHCQTCSVNTAMPKHCSICSASTHNGNDNRIRKDGPNYYRMCNACGIEERVWHETNQQ